jgi:hypothetical protein
VSKIDANQKVGRDDKSLGLPVLVDRALAERILSTSVKDFLQILEPLLAESKVKASGYRFVQVQNHLKTLKKKTKKEQLDKLVNMKTFHST